MKRRILSILSCILVCFITLLILRGFEVSKTLSIIVTSIVGGLSNAIVYEQLGKINKIK